MDFEPKQGDVCTTVRFTGAIYDGSAVGGVFFNGKAGLNPVIQRYPPLAFSAPNNLFATVPPGATSGPLEVKLSSSVLGVIGSDQTFDPGFRVINTPPAPTITNFTADNPQFHSNQGTTLRWSVTGTVTSLVLSLKAYETNFLGQDVTGKTSLFIDPGAGSGGRAWIYTLTANNSCI